MVLLAESNHDGRTQSPVGLFGASAQTEFSLLFEELEEMIHRFFMKRWVLSDEALPDALPIDEEVVKVIRVSPQRDFEDRQTIWWMAVHLHTRQLYGSMWIRSAQNCANVMTCIYSFALIVIDLQWYLRADWDCDSRLHWNESTWKLTRRRRKASLDLKILKHWTSTSFLWLLADAISNYLVFMFLWGT